MAASTEVDGGCVGFVLWLSFSTMTREVEVATEFPKRVAEAPELHRPGPVAAATCGSDRLSAPLLIGDR